MAPLSQDAKRVVRPYEPVFRAMLVRWLEAQTEVTGNSSLTLDDVSAGVAHTFAAYGNRVKIRIGDSDKTAQEIAAGNVITIAEAKSELAHNQTAA